MRGEAMLTDRASPPTHVPVPVVVIGLMELASLKHHGGVVLVVLPALRASHGSPICASSYFQA